MKIHTMFTDCLSYEQLVAYSSGTTDKPEKASLYRHIASCELCACAVNGFAAVPFTNDDLVAIHHEIDARSNATHANPLTFSRAMIIAVSILSIIGVYTFTNHSSGSTSKMIPVNSKTLNKIYHETKNPPPAEIPFTEKANEKVSAPVKKLSGVIHAVEVEQLAPLKVEHIPLPEEILNQPMATAGYVYHFNSNVIYLYDLKVADYNNLYFNPGLMRSDFRGGLSSDRENKDSPVNLMESDLQKSIPANQVLKKGLELFSKGKYRKACAEFQLLIDVNPKDVNALFYQAVSAYQTGHYQTAINDLQALLKNENNVFHPEAKWNLALVQLKSGDKDSAKEILSEIVMEKGFYARKASDKLKGL